jgi:protein-S-isoprenylcysteine O-methyltransferase Ste14
MIFERIISIFWIIFIICWFVAAFFAKRTVKWSSSGMIIRLAIAVLLVTLAQSKTFSLSFAFHGSSAVGWIGVILAGIGIGFALWARAHLGRNWGMPMSVKENPDLVMTGPYAFVRNPIYGGMIIAFLGTAVVFGLFWWVIFLSFGGYFVFTSYREEQNLQKLFPTQYPAYRARTKMLIPFIF